METAKQKQEKRKTLRGRPEGKPTGRNAIRNGRRARLSRKEHREDALALGAEERRDKLRKAAGRSKYPESRGYLNGGTHMERLHVSVTEQADAEQVAEGNPAN